jgi:crossover junction endodeoxyribonuclease RuvC
MRVLGIDCGTEFTGFGVVDAGPTAKLQCVDCGAIRVSPREPMARRLEKIHEGIAKLIRDHQPEQVAIEDVFYAVNVKSALTLGQVRGVAMLAAATAGLEVAEYAPLSIKSAVVGYGKAEKSQVQFMVMRLLELTEPPESEDAADALAIAICHLHTWATLERQRAVAGRR